jgi:hypothetical protein
MLNETRIAARVPESLREELSRLATANDRPLSYEIRRGLRELVVRENPGGGLSSSHRLDVDAGPPREGGFSGPSSPASVGEP